ncbi:hypothetical protein FACS1894217_06930 [Clostridia bacterium]|nr:hypothetical protein FACS1894217_06930 [Clostridia bacterium]
MAYLNEIDKLAKYLDTLGSFARDAERYTVIVAGKYDFTRFIDKKLAQKFNAIGISASLDSIGCQAFIGVIGSEPKFEKTSAETLVHEFEICNKPSRVVSTPDNNQQISIIIDGTDYAINRMGINIVVYDKYTNDVVDAVHFDTVRKNFPCRRNAGLEVLLSKLNFINASPYSLFQYCLDNGIKKLSIYTDKKHWQLAEPLLFPFIINRNKFPIIKGCYSNEAFSTAFGQSSNHFGVFKCEDVNKAKFTDKDTVLFIQCNPSIEAMESVRNSGAKPLLISQVVTAMEVFCTYVRPVKLFMQKHPGVGVIGLRRPKFPEGSALRSENEEKLYSTPITRSDWISAVERGEKITTSFDGLGYDLFSPEFKEIYMIPPSHINNDGIKVYDDFSGTYLNLKDGRRCTTGQPENPKRTVYISGGCFGFSTHARDSRTIASVLQNNFNVKCPDRAIRVENFSVFAAKAINHQYDCLSSIPAEQGDLVVILDANPQMGIPIIELKDLFNRPHEYGEVFSDRPNHFNENGYRVIAEKLFEFIETNDFFVDFNNEEVTLLPPVKYCFGVPGKYLDTGGANIEYGNDLLAYKQSLSEIRQRVLGRIGAIVMNCNPFTLGHRYLIEHAANRVKHLFIFAVEEDKSIFPFADRFKLMEAGTKDLPNVTVLPSGKFIISSLTFSDYFNKSEMQDRAIDPSQDVELFATEIAPTLNITVRFAGEEPLDNVTRQYNEAMGRILPKHGIAFEVIPRKESDGAPISASRVRTLLKDNDFDAIAEIVPQSTLDYLKEKYDGKR